MALGDPYATVGELKARLDVNDAVDDLQLERALKTATTGINAFTGRQFNKVSVVSARRYRPDNYCLVKVDDFYDTTGLIVETDDSDVGTFGTTWSTTDYDTEPLNGIVDGEPGWPYWKIRTVGSRYFFGGRRPTVRVTALWGWAAVPEDVHEACLISAVEIFKLKDTPFGVGGYGDFGIIRVRDNPFVARMLARYVTTPFLVA